MTKRAAWYAIATNAGFVVKKTRNPKIRGGRYAFGPYKTKGKACQVGMYQRHGNVPRGCEGVSVRRDN
jgi:hypothetical protein